MDRSERSVATARPDNRLAALPDRPLRLSPMRLGRPWGGGRFGVVDGGPIGEVWVTGDDATLPDGRTLAASGLAELVPLVKLLDVEGRLSVQVHPDDAAAVELRGPDAVGKHECWVILEAPAGATVALGMEPGATVDDLFSGDDGRIAAALRMRPVATGTILDIAPGTVHAPGGGLLLYEVQQRSDLTFRIWDWGRPRPLHLDEARRCLRPEAEPLVGALPVDPGPVTVSAPGAPFRLASCHLDGTGGPAEIALDGVGVLTVARGTLRLVAGGAGPIAGVDRVSDAGRDAIALEAGSHWLVPAGPWSLSGSGDALLAWDPTSGGATA